MHKRNVNKLKKKSRGGLDFFIRGDWGSRGELTSQGGAGPHVNHLMCRGQYA